MKDKVSIVMWGRVRFVNDVNCCCVVAIDES
jgi:hypothetical protein